MKTSILSVVIIVVMNLVLQAHQNQNRSLGEEHENLKREVHELIELSMRLFKEKDLDGLVNRFDPQGSLKLPGNSLIKGHDQIREFYTGTLQLTDFNLQLKLTHIEVSQVGDMAWALADFTVTFTSPGGPFHDNGTSLMVLKRVDNQWKIMAENVSSEKMN